MSYKVKKIVFSLILFIIVSVVYLLFICNMPMEEKNDHITKVLISSVPTYIMLYISLLIHLLNYIMNSTILFIVDDPHYNTWDISFNLKVHNYTDKSFELKRIESQQLGVYKFDHPNNIAKKDENNIFKIKMTLKNKCKGLEDMKYIHADVVYADSNTRYSIKFKNKWGNTNAKKVQGT